MKKILLLFVGLCSITLAKTQGQTPLNIIPEPVSVERVGGQFQLPASLTIAADWENPAIRNTVMLFSKKLETAAGISESKVDLRQNAALRFQINDIVDLQIGEEGYLLEVSPETGVTISANQPAGLFYGVQTLLQLLPPAIESSALVPQVDWVIPAVKIRDYPRFGWRGMMFDVVRHFFSKEDVKQYIDQMVKYKLNLLHLHLTDDEGWRIEIKSLPRLTTVGAWRVNKTGTFGNFSKPGPNEPKDYGGFYTQEDIRELVQYAQDRFVNILPEVDVPGHSLAAIAAYPELSCTPGADKYQVRSGEKIMEWPPSGHFYGLLDNTLCPANEKVYDFLDKVFTEVAQLFPFEYIHMGGDETARNFWEKMPEIKALMKKENLKNLDEVQSYFVKRVEKIVESKGKKLIGWDEILQGGLAPNAAVMSWRGLKGGIEAAQQNHEVVMSPTTYVYFDYMQGDKIIEPPVYASLRLKKVYEFDPLPPGVSKKYIKGGQANLWTEQVYNMRHAEYMTWPRAFALSEDVWSQPEKKNWTRFVQKTEAQFPRLDFSKTKYATSMYDPVFAFSGNAKGEIIVTLSTEVEGLSIHYSFDNSFPDQYYPVYDKPVIVPKDASLMKVVTYRGDQQVGRIISFPVAEMKKRAGMQ
ncbi:MAG: family 20 glycosylhydrolase [Terrimonas sp.]|nr:family 20 glycosylhydrolase [Terrimonas sp.]